MENLNQKLLKVFIAFIVSEIANHDPFSIAKIFQKVDSDVILLSDFFEKEYPLEKLFKISDAILSEDEYIKRVLLRSNIEEWFNNMNELELYDFKKNALVFMLDVLDAPVDVKYAILKDLSEKNASRFFEQIYDVFTKKNAYFNMYA